jgi:hypothetical protein
MEVAENKKELNSSGISLKKRDSSAGFLASSFLIISSSCNPLSRLKDFNLFHVYENK